MFALIDCNNFYVSAERIFRLDLREKPVFVASPNDGCVIARSAEVKALGVKMGIPVYQIKPLIDQYHITFFSSNLTLYQDISDRCMAVISDFAPQSTIYSIDEIFLFLHGMTIPDLKIYGQGIVQKVYDDVGVPVCAGIAPTKTLAKLANRFAKKFPGYKGVCVMDTPDKVKTALSLTAVDDIWGIGDQYGKLLSRINVKTARQFIELPRQWVRSHMTVVGEKIYRELRGESCLEIDDIDKIKKTISTTQSFGQPITELSDLCGAIASYASRCALKLRKQQSNAVEMCVFIGTNPFRKDQPQYHNSIKIELPFATSSTSILGEYAREGVKKIFVPGLIFKHGGVVVTKIVSQEASQGNIFYQGDKLIQITRKHQNLMGAIDQINTKHGRDTVYMASAGKGKHNSISNHKSPCYTTNINDIPRVKI